MRGQHLTVAKPLPFSMKPFVNADLLPEKASWVPPHLRFEPYNFINFKSFYIINCLNYLIKLVVA